MEVEAGAVRSLLHVARGSCCECDAASRKRRVHVFGDNAIELMATSNVGRTWQDFRSKDNV
jgi:hypothetical protein